MYSEHCQTFKIGHFAKRIMTEGRSAAIKFSRQEGEWGVCGARALE